VVNGLALTCKFPLWHSWESQETSTGSYGICCKPAHTVHVVNNFNFNFNLKFDRKKHNQRRLTTAVHAKELEQPPYVELVLE
jgi:hypothetical protein